jgi:3',5'-cyclic AMP phosphodiesterase CpdA
MRIVHFSDPHVQLRGWKRRAGRDLDPLRSVATAELWLGRGARYEDAEEKLRRLAAVAAHADHAICTGDLTQLGHPEEFARARAALEPLARDPGRFTVLAGNHDRYPWNGRPSRLFEEHFPEQARTDVPGPLPVKLLGDVALVAVDSNGPLCWPKLSAGRILRDDLAALRSALHAPELQGRCRIVLVHHAPVLRDGRPDLPWRTLRRGRALLRCAAEAGADAVLCGHIHDRYTVPRPTLLANAGSSTERGREGYFELEIRSSKLVRIESRPL